MARLIQVLLCLPLAGFLALVALPLRAQSTQPPTAADHKRGAPPPPTHAPQPEVSPLTLFAHVRAGHDRWLAARRDGKPVPAPAERPAGAGRHVCAVVVCSDCDLDVPGLLGLHRADVLLFSVPGPFVGPEVTAAIEREAVQQRLGLVLVFSHTRCTTLEPPPGATPRDVLTTRAEAAAQDSLRRRQPLRRTLAQAQRQLLLASSEELSRRAAGDRLRVVPAELDSDTGAITWHLRPIEAMPMPPVR